MKNTTPCGKYSLTIQTQTPKERLKFLQDTYNSMEGSYCNNDLKRKMQLLYDEIKHILKFNPELKAVELKTYDYFNAS